MRLVAVESRLHTAPESGGAGIQAIAGVKQACGAAGGGIQRLSRREDEIRGDND
jgi:hypothetical protein